MQDAPTIFLVEDDDGHARLVENWLRNSGFRNPLVRFHDGQEALEYLTAPEPPSESHGAPTVMLLDIRMPKIDGIEVLQRIRGSSRFNAMPIVMLTTTDDPSEAQRCRQLGCTSYIVKPVNPKLFTAALQGLAGYLAPPPPPATVN